jgi:hypothetical protein
VKQIGHGFSQDSLRQTGFFYNSQNWLALTAKFAGNIEQSLSFVFSILLEFGSWATDQALR